MGVLACDRYGCENIMCDFYSHTYGYLCYECKNELENTPMTDLQSFMLSSKCTYPAKNDWVEKVNAEFKSRYCEENK